MVKKGIIYSVIVIGGLIFLIVLIIGMMQLAVVNQHVSEPADQTLDLPTDNPNVSVRADEGMFTLFAALNAAGYDMENFDLPYSPVRQLVRERLSGIRFSGQERLRTSIQVMHPYALIVWRLHYGQFPEFKRVQSGWWDKSIPAFAFFGLDSQMRSFYEEMKIGDLWEEVRPMYEEEAALYQQAGGQAVQNALNYCRMQDIQLKKFVIIPNLLDAHWSGKGPTVGDVAYVVVGPSEEGKADIDLLQHEALHSIVGPLVEANLTVINEENRSELYKALKTHVPSSYGSWESIIEEQVVRAIDCRLSIQSCENFGLANDEAQGFLLERTLVEKLKDYEQSGLSLVEYMPELLQSINDIHLP